MHKPLISFLGTMKQKRSTKQKRNMKPINITDLNVDVLKLIMVFVAKSSDGARSFARTTSVCKGFLELAEDTEVLKTVVFDKGRVSRFGESFWKIDGLLCKCLQQMLADKAFRGYEDTSENWVLSITSLFGALNGTTRAYLDGMQPEDGRSMEPICLLQLLRFGVIFYYNFGFDHFNMSWKNIGVWGLADCLMGNTGHFASGDWILSDLTIQGPMRLNSHLRTFPDTFYFSYATKRTTRIAGIEEEVYARCYDSQCSQRVRQCALKDPRCL